MSDTTNEGGNLEAGPHTDEAVIASILQPERKEPKALKNEAKEAFAPVVEAEETEEVEAATDEAIDEVADEIDDGDDDAPEDDEAEDDFEDESDEPEISMFTVKINGEEFEVTQDELVAGYQKGADYHRKTAALAEEKRSFETQMQQRDEQWRIREAAILERFGGAEAQQPDWVKLASELDPWEYQRQRAEWDHGQSERQQARQQAAQIRTQGHQRIVAEETHKLLEDFGWKTTEEFEKGSTELFQAASSVGFTKAEFDNAVDHRVFKLARLASKWLKHEASLKAPLKKVTKPATKVLRPGNHANGSQRRAADQDTLRKNMRRKGDDASAVAFLLGGK